MPSFIVIYIVLNNLREYYSTVAPKLDLYAGKNHEYFLLFIITAIVTLITQLLYLVITILNIKKPELISVFLALNFVISIVSVNLMITGFNLLLFTNLAY
jgi:hypothetical protein